MTVNINLQSKDAQGDDQELNIDFEVMSDSEIRQKAEELRNEVWEVQKQIEENSNLLQEYRAKLKTLIPDITEIQQIANKRAETLDRCRFFEKKILSIYNRFPEILSAEQIKKSKKEIISTDANILATQLKGFEQRAARAKAELQELEKKREKQQQIIIDLWEQIRRQDNLLDQRQQDKDNLCRALKQELDTSKTLYVSDGRAIEKKIKTAENMSNELEVNLGSLQNQYENLLKQIAEVMQHCPPQNCQIAHKIASRQQELIKSVEQYTAFWSTRRNSRHYADRKEFLNNVATKTQERYDQSYKSIDYLKSQNLSREEERRNIQSMNQQLDNRLEEKKRKHKDLIATKESMPPVEKLPKDVQANLESSREQVQQLESRVKSLEIEFQINNDKSPERNEGETRFEESRKHYRTLIQEAAMLRNNIAEYKKKQADQAKHQLCVLYPLSAVQDARLVLTEEQPPCVQAASLDLLERLVFYPGNVDEYYLTGLLVYVHTEKIDIAAFVQAIVSHYHNAECDQQRRDEQLHKLLEIWSKWFPNDFQDASTQHIFSPLINLAGRTGDFQIEPESKIIELRRQEIPFNKKEELPFISSPLIIAEHFTYVEIQLLRSIPASEFVGCSWTTSEKWTKAPRIMKFTEHFNHIVTYIIFTIIQAKADQRLRVIERWIQIMDAAAEVINYQLVFEIYSALCSPAVSNDDIWTNLSTDTKNLYKKYSLLTAPSGRFANYRKHLQQHPPQTVVPYIGPFLTSLVYISDGNPSKKRLPDVKDPVINFQKFQAYAKVLDDILAPWGKDMVFYLSDDLVKTIQTIPIVDLSESELFKRSQAK